MNINTAIAILKEYLKNERRALQHTVMTASAETDATGAAFFMADSDPDCDMSVWQTAADADSRAWKHLQQAERVLSLCEDAQDALMTLACLLEDMAIETKGL